MDAASKDLRFADLRFAFATATAEISQSSVLHWVLRALREFFFLLALHGAPSRGPFEQGTTISAWRLTVQTQENPLSYDAAPERGSRMTNA